MVKAGIKDFNNLQQHIFNQSNNQEFGSGIASSYLMHSKSLTTKKLDYFIHPNSWAMARLTGLFLSLSYLGLPVIHPLLYINNK